MALAADIEIRSLVHDLLEEGIRLCWGQVPYWNFPYRYAGTEMIPDGDG